MYYNDIMMVLWRRRHEEKAALRDDGAELVVQYHQVVNLHRLVSNSPKKHTLKNLKLKYKAVTKKNYSGANSKKAFHKHLNKNFFGKNSDVIESRSIENGRWGVVCPDCDIFWGMQPSTNRIGFEPVDTTADVYYNWGEYYDGKFGLRCRRCDTVIKLE